MNENQLLTKVRQLCTERGLLFFHVPDSRKNQGPSGFPDLVIAGRDRIIFRELKGSEGVMQPQQRRWGQRLKRAGLDWAPWRPADLDSGVIRKQLDELAGQQALL